MITPVWGSGTVSLSKIKLMTGKIHSFSSTISRKLFRNAATFFHKSKIPQVNMSWVTVGDMGVKSQDLSRPAINKTVYTNPKGHQIVMSIRSPNLIRTACIVLPSLEFMGGPHPDSIRIHSFQNSCNHITKWNSFCDEVSIKSK